MLSIKSSYRSLRGNNTGSESNRSLGQEKITPGICDYIPQEYFSKQYFCILIEGNDTDQIIRSIFWNQYYEKTLLKQIFYQLNNTNCTNHTSRFNNFQPKTDNQTIYLKVQNKVYNLKEKIQFDSHSLLEKEISSAKSLSIQKINQDGKWKKIDIHFGPYKNNQQFDIVFICSTIHQSEQIIANLFHEQNLNNIGGNNNKQNIQHRQSKRIISTNSNVRHSNTRHNNTRHDNTSTKMISQKRNQTFTSAKKQKSNSQFYSARKVNTIKQNDRISQNPNKSQKQTNIHAQSMMKSNASKKSSKSQIINKRQIINKKAIKNLQSSPNQLGVLEEINFNTTAKLLQHKTQNIAPSMIGAPISMDLKRKQKFKVKQNSIFQKENFLPLQSDLLNKITQSSKSNSVMAQILSKKEQTIYNQKKKIQQIERKHMSEIQQLKIKQTKETQMFKNQISTILNQYSAKYQKQQAESKFLRDQVTSLNRNLTQNKVLIAELQVKNNSCENDKSRYSRQLQVQKEKIAQIEQKYQELLISSKDQQSKLINQKNDAIGAKQKYLQKYTLLSKKVKFLMHQENMDQQHQ